MVSSLKKSKILRPYRYNLYFRDITTGLMATQSKVDPSGSNYRPAKQKCDVTNYTEKTLKQREIKYKHYHFHNTSTLTHFIFQCQVVQVTQRCNELAGRANRNMNGNGSEREGEGISYLIHHVCCKCCLASLTLSDFSLIYIVSIYINESLKIRCCS